MHLLALGLLVVAEHLEGDVPDGGDYFSIPFDVPAGTVEVEIAHDDLSDENILDWGAWSPDGFRGWGGGLVDNAVVGVDESSRGYLPGPLPAGRWEVMVGKALITRPPGRYSVDITLRTEATLTPRPRAEPTGAALSTGARWYAGDLHVHSSESGDADASMPAIRDYAEQRGLDFVVLSDHNTVSQHALLGAFQAQSPRVLFMRGAEVTTYAGHGNALGVTHYVDHRIGWQERTAVAMITDVHDAGGLWIINHPMLDLGTACIGCAWKHADTPWNLVGALEIHTGTWKPIVQLFTTQAIALWDDKLDSGLRITAVGGSDDHRAGQDTGNFPSHLGSPCTRVFAEELSEGAIIRAIRAGRVVVALRGPDDPQLDLHASASTGTAGIGETVAAPSVDLRVDVTGGDGMLAVLVRNGVTYGSYPVTGTPWQVTVPADVAATGDRWRAHVVDADGLDVVVTNHVFTTFQEAPSSPGGCGCSGGTPAGLAAGALFLLRRRRAACRGARVP